MPDYSWKDTNLALFGSDKERAVKKDAAQTEPAWKPVMSINSSTTMVWRIKNFKLEEVKPEDFGKFFSGDSYVILHTDKVGNELVYDVYFWIGAESTADEYGTAAYKTVELDTLLDDKAVQHREVDGFESQEFKSYFPKLEKLAGGYASGFNHVKPEEFRNRLLVYHGLDRNHVELSEVSYTRRSIQSDDVFILDLGTKAYQWNGFNASKDEKFRPASITKGQPGPESPDHCLQKTFEAVGCRVCGSTPAGAASQFLQQLEADRNGRCVTVVIDQSDREGTAEFMSHLPDEPIHEKPKQEIGKKAIYKLSDESGKLKVSLVCEEHLSRGALTHDDAYFIDNGVSLFVYIGKNCSRAEKVNAIPHAHEYLKGTTHPFVPIVVVSEGRKSKELDKVLE